jgi:hypothetical protein
MQQLLKFILFLGNTLHVSDGLSVHHQELKTVHTATGILQTGNAVCTPHVLDGLSVHHQEFKTVHTATGICHTGSVAAC